MNQLKNFVIALICIFIFSFSASAQNDLVLGIDYGHAKSINENQEKFNLFNEGSNATLSLSYFFGNFGISAGVNTIFARAEGENKEDLIALIRAGQNGATHGHVRTFAGPAFRGGKGKLGVFISPKIGLSKSPLQEILVLTEAGDGERILTTLTQQKSKFQPLIAGELGINFKVTPRLALQVKTDYVSNKPFSLDNPIFAAKANDTSVPMDDVLNTLNIDQLLSTDLNQVNFSAGIQIVLGGGHGGATRGNIVSIPVNKKCNCFKNCVDDQMADCKYNKRNCKNDAKQCKRDAKANFRSCKSNCSGSRKAKRQCKKACKKTFKSTKKTCKTDKKRCKKMKCKKGNYAESCEKKCGCK